MIVLKNAQMKCFLIKKVNKKEWKKESIPWSRGKYHSCRSELASCCLPPTTNGQLSQLLYPGCAATIRIIEESDRSSDLQSEPDPQIWHLAGLKKRNAPKSYSFRHEICSIDNSFEKYWFKGKLQRNRKHELITTRHEWMTRFHNRTILSGI